MFGKTFLSGAVGLVLVLAPVTAGQAAAAPAAADDQPGAAAVTVYYDTSSAPSFRSAIRQGAANWNASVSNVKLQENVSVATLDFYEGNNSNGSYAYTDGHGHGYIFIDYSQASVYDVIRIAAHETGHALGLPDHYSGPCSELMSGGGPGPSCHNAHPNATERSQVNSLWANGRLARGELELIDEPSPVGAH